MFLTDSLDLNHSKNIIAKLSERENVPQKTESQSYHSCISVQFSPVKNNMKQ